LPRPWSAASVNNLWVSVTKKSNQCIKAHPHTHTHTSTHPHTHTHTHTHTNSHTSIHTHTRARARTHTHARTHIHTHGHGYTQTDSLMDQFRRPFFKEQHLGRCPHKFGILKNPQLE
jgi:hypothetical protein